MRHCCRLKILKNFWNQDLVFYVSLLPAPQPQYVLARENALGARVLSSIPVWALSAFDFQRHKPLRGETRLAACCGENERRGWERLLGNPFSGVKELKKKTNERNTLSIKIYLVSESIVRSQDAYLGIFLLYFVFRICSLKITYSHILKRKPNNTAAKGCRYFRTHLFLLHFVDV